MAVVVVACQEIVSTDRPRSPQSDDRKHWFQTPAATKRCKPYWHVPSHNRSLDSSKRRGLRNAINLVTPNKISLRAASGIDPFELCNFNQTEL